MRFGSFDVTIFSTLIQLNTACCFSVQIQHRKLAQEHATTCCGRRRRETRDSENNTRTIRQKTRGFFYTSLIEYEYEYEYD